MRQFLPVFGCFVRVEAIDTGADRTVVAATGVSRIPDRTATVIWPR